MKWFFRANIHLIKIFFEADLLGAVGFLCYGLLWFLIFMLFKQGLLFLFR